MKNLLILLVLFAAGCGGNNADHKKGAYALTDEINSSGKITDEQAESLSRVRKLHLNGLTTITDEQAESLSKVEGLGISEACQKQIGKYIK